VDQTPPPPPIRKTCKRYNVPGHAHFLTFSCFHRRPFLTRDRSRGWMIDAIALACRRHGVALWAWVIMPEHVHLLLFPRHERYSISAFLATMKQSVTQRAIRYVRAKAPHFIPQMTDLQPNGEQSLRFWQRGGGYDHNLWSTDKIWEKIDYMHDNPVKRKLVSRPEDWAWSSYGDFAGIRKGPLPLDWEFLPR
jgi:putative transposase